MRPTDHLHSAQLFMIHKHKLFCLPPCPIFVCGRRSTLNGTAYHRGVRATGHISHGRRLDGSAWPRSRQTRTNNQSDVAALPLKRNCNCWHRDRANVSIKTAQNSPRLAARLDLAHLTVTQISNRDRSLNISTRVHENARRSGRCCGTFR